MAKHWLQRAVDWSPRVEAEWTSRHQLSKIEQTDAQLRSGKLFQISKQLCKAPIGPLEKPKTKDNRADKTDAERKQTDYLKRLAEHICKPENHAASGLTLVIVNTVDRAMRLFDLLRRQSELEDVHIKLIHSRFRPYEREQWLDFLGQKDSSRRILVSTQVVEAGVDLSAAVLYTELAPWASLVQRFGRCARYPGESGQVNWLDLDLGTDRQPVDHWARPYDRPQLIAARERLSILGDVGLKALTGLKAEIELEQTGERSAKLFPYEPRFVPRDKDLFDLFDTTPDLTGTDVDVSRYIRDGEELDVQVFWREIPVDQEPAKKDRPNRRELCPVPFHRFRDFASEALKQRHRIWRRHYSKGRNRTSPWERLDFGSIDQVVYPGQVFLLDKSCGGYMAELGWTGDPQHSDFELPPTIEMVKVTAQDDEDDDDSLSISKWLTVLEHSRDVCQKLETMLDQDGLNESEVKVLRLAARWHDRGKAHPAFTAKLKTELLANADVQQRLGGQPPAKAPDNAWRRDGVKANGQGDERRPGHRHELASALAILETLASAQPAHEALAWPDGLDKSNFGSIPEYHSTNISASDPLVEELEKLSADELDLLLYLVAAHHGKVRMSLRSSPDDERDDVPEPCPADKRQARGVREGDQFPACQIPAADLSAAAMVAPKVTLTLDLMELGLSRRYGALMARAHTTAARTARSVPTGLPRGSATGGRLPGQHGRGRTRTGGQVMAAHILELRGCTPEPLGNYLKGLGVFRLIAEQADPQARAWWKGGILRVYSCFAKTNELTDWFRNCYAPSPLLAPWSVNSGLWPPKKLPAPRGDKRATPNAVLRQLVNATYPRFRLFKESISTFLQFHGGGCTLPSQESELTNDLRQLLKELESQPKKARTRSQLMREIRNMIPNREGVAWLDSIGTVRAARDNPAILFSLLADGATEGVNSFVGNFYGRLCDHLSVNSSPTDFWTTEVGNNSLARLKNAALRRQLSQRS